MRDNNRVPYVDVLAHQAARRDALAMGQVPVEEEAKPPSLNAFLWSMFGILCSLILVLWAIKP